VIMSMTKTAVGDAPQRPDGSLRRTTHALRRRAIPRWLKKLWSRSSVGSVFRGPRPLGRLSDCSFRRGRDEPSADIA
jgi:hypothetical protein